MAEDKVHIEQLEEFLQCFVLTEGANAEYVLIFGNSERRLELIFTLTWTFLQICAQAMAKSSLMKKLVVPVSLTS